jgi:hypothetical protein
MGVEDLRVISILLVGNAGQDAEPFVIWDALRYSYLGPANT